MKFWLTQGHLSATQEYKEQEMLPFPFINIFHTPNFEQFHWHVIKEMLWP